MARNVTSLRLTRESSPLAVAQRDGGQHLVGAAGQQPQHALRILAVQRLAENLAIDHHGRIRGEHRPRQRSPRFALAQAGVGLGCGEPRDIGERRLRGAGRLVDLDVKYLKRHAYLLEQLAPARRGGGQIDEIRAHALKDTDLAPL